jgi:hypothetical protein
VARTPAGSAWEMWSGYSMLLSRFLVRGATSIEAQARQHAEKQCTWREATCQPHGARMIAAVPYWASCGPVVV